MNPAEIIEALKSLLAALPEGVSGVDQSSLTNKGRTELRRLITEAIKRLEELAIGLDPIRQPPVMFDPSNPDVVGRLIGETLIEQNRAPLDRLPRFYGSGVYSIYYNGKFSAYLPATRTDTPLYVGKADPEISEARSAIEQGTKLWGRLGEHAKSIRSATNLDINDFECRYLVVKSSWQSTAELYLISVFKPVWNNEVGICFGLGKHGDSATTRSNTRSPWDTLHPGRVWATKEGNRANPLTPKQIIGMILNHYKENPPRKQRTPWPAARHASPQIRTLYSQRRAVETAPDPPEQKKISARYCRPDPARACPRVLSWRACPAPPTPVCSSLRSSPIFPGG